MTSSPRPRRPPAPTSIALDPDSVHAAGLPRRSARDDDVFEAPKRHSEAIRDASLRAVAGAIFRRDVDDPRTTVASGQPGGGVAYGEIDPEAATIRAGGIEDARGPS